MRICLIGNARAVHIERWSAAYAERGHDVHVLSVNRNDLGPASVQQVAVGQRTRWAAPWTFASYARLALEARHRLDAIDPDVVHAHYTVTHGAISSWAGRRPRAVSVWGSDLLLDHNPLQRAAWNALNRYAVRDADLICSTSAYMRDRMLRHLEPGQRIELVPFGVDTDVFRPAAPQHRPVFRVGFVKTLSATYGPDVLLRAFAEFAADKPDVELVMAGRGGLAADLRAQADRLGIADRTRWLGFVPHAEVAALMRELDVLVSPSRAESFGVALLEASASGVPTIAARVQGVPEVVDHLETGILVPVDDPAAISTALDGLYNDPDRRRAMGVSGRRLVLDRYRWSDCVDRMLALLEGIRR